MSYDDARTAHLRLSHADRDAAVAALAGAEADGRLTSAELAERTAVASNAVTRGDLAPLFADLPDSEPGAGAGAGVGAGAGDPAAASGTTSAAGSTTAPAPAPQAQPAPAFAPDYGYQGPGYGGPGYGGPGYNAPDAAYRRSAPLGGAGGVIAVSVTPFIALALFLACGFFLPGGFAWSWIFWLAVPVVGIVVWGPSGRGHDNR